MRRQGSAQFDPSAGAWLGEAKPCGMEKIAAERRQKDLADRQLRCRAVERVAHDRMMKGGEVHADLVRAAGVQLDLNERRCIDAGQDAPIRPARSGKLNASKRK